MSTPVPTRTPTLILTPQPTATPSPTVAPTTIPLPSGPVPSITTLITFPALPAGTFGDRPVVLSYPPDGSNRVIVVDQDGRVSIFENSVDTSVATTFLDLSETISREGNEEGLLGFAFHPNYTTNGYFYAYYSAASP